MGNILSSGHGGVEEVSTQASGAYKYPPSGGGSFFANHFIMGGEKFDSPQPEAFLFGENSDLNFLGGKPVPFPYPPPQPNEPTKTLRSLINIRRDSVHFVHVPSGSGVVLAAPEDDSVDASEAAESSEDQKSLEDAKKNRRYNIKFTFDSDVRCAVTIYFFCAEEIGPQGVSYVPKESGFQSETFYYKRGASQVFLQPSLLFQPGLYPDDWLTFGEECSNIPIAIQCVSLEGDSPRQSHTTLAIVERSSDGGYIFKAYKQKLFVDGLTYLLQEIYGLENKTSMSHPHQYDDDDDDDDCGADCVVCMCDLRDTIILPCRHLCLCYACAESLRYQANNCPICRAPFIALLQIRAVQRVSHATHPALAGTEPGGQDGVPPGYQSVSLVEALNGPGNESPMTAQPAVAVGGDGSTARSTSSAKKGSRSKRKGSQDGHSKSTKSQPVKAAAATPEATETEMEVRHGTARGTVEVKIVNEVGSQYSPNLDQARAVQVGTSTPPSLDLVDEELAHLEGTTQAQTSSSLLKKKLSPPTHLQLDQDDDDDDLDNIPPNTALVGVAASGSLPGTPMSGTSVRSSQDSASSATSTKQLLPTAADITTQRISAPVTVSFTPAPTILKVVPTKGDEDNC